MALVIIAKWTGSSASSVVVNEAAATYGAVAADELAISVGANVPNSRKSTDTREALKRLSHAICKSPRAAPAAGSLAVYSLPLGVTVDGHSYAAELEATAINEDRIALVIGADVAKKLSSSLPVVTAIGYCLTRFAQDYSRQS